MPISHAVIRKKIGQLQSQLNEIKMPGAKHDGRIIKDSKGRYDQPFRDIVLELANLHRELNQNAKAAEYYMELLDHSSEFLPHNYPDEQIIHAKADIYRQLGLYTEAEEIYKQVLEDHSKIATSTSFSNAIRDRMLHIGSYVLPLYKLPRVSYYHQSRYKQALIGLANVYRDQAINSPSDNDITHAKAIQCYLESSEIKNSFDLYTFELDLGYIRDTFHHDSFPDNSLLSAGFLYEKLGESTDAIEIYKMLITSYLEAERATNDHPNVVRKTALRLAALTGELKYYEMATAKHHRIENDSTLGYEVDLELLHQELLAADKYIKILESKTKTQPIEKSNYEQMENTYQNAATLIAGVQKHLHGKNKTNWLGKVQQTESFKIYALITEINDLSDDGTKDQYTLEIEKEIEKLPVRTKLTLLLKIIQQTDQPLYWLEKADMLQNQLLNSDNYLNLLGFIRLAVLHATNNNWSRVEEIFDLSINALSNLNLEDHTKDLLYTELLKIFDIKTFTNEPELLMRKIILNKYAINNIKVSASLSQYRLAQAIEEAQKSHPEMIKDIETQLKIKLYDAVYWYRESANNDYQPAIEKYDVMFQDKLDKMPVRYRERLEQVLECNLTGLGSTIYLPASIAIKLNGRLQSKTYNSDQQFQNQMFNKASETLRLKRDRDYYVESVDITENLVNVVDPSTMQVISGDIPVQIDANDHYYSSSVQTMKEQISKVLIPNKILANLLDYILRSENIDIAEFTGFINPKTGKRYIEPWLTKEGDTVEKDDPRAYCQNNKALEIMTQFPSIKEMLKSAEDELAANKDTKGLAHLFLAAKQAELEGSEKFIEQAKQMLIKYIEASKNPVLRYIKLDTKESFIGLVEKAMQIILADEYTKLKEVIMCPITFECMLNPVTLQSGNTYEASAIEEHLSGAGRDPLTNKVMNDTSLISNRAVANIIPQIIAQAHANKPINLTKLAGLKDKDRVFYISPFLTKNGKTVEKDDPKAVRPNHMLKGLIGLVKPQSRNTLKPS